MEKYFYFSTGSDDNAEGDAVLYPVSSFRGLTPASDTTCVMYFTPMKITDVATSDVNDAVTLTFKHGHFSKVIRLITKGVQSSGNLISIIDAENSKYANQIDKSFVITGVSITFAT